LLATCLAGAVPAAAQQAAEPTATKADAASLDTASPDSLALSGALARIYRGDVPRTVDELRMMDAHQRRLVRNITRATVAIQIGSTQGSGVIVHPDGYVLTAAHVARQPGLRAQVLLSDGRRVRATTLGMNKDLDAGLIKLDSGGAEGSGSPWPHTPMGRATELAAGAWCIALGHAGGYQPDRADPVVRVGRVLTINARRIETDCKLVGGDSGGPLFDMEGRVIGINSRIGLDLNKNVHVPVDAFHDSWERLASGESWGSFLEIIGRPIIGVYRFDDSDEPKVKKVSPGSPAEQAGIKAGDMITKFNDQQVTTFSQLVQLVQEHEPGDEVTIELRRDGQTRVIQLVLGAAR
jgi:S1-C subfamily serine protease